jgi:hypothetical protein
MGWKTIYGHEYYYESYREGDRVRTRYCGRGIGAEIAEASAAEAREERRQAREAEREQVKALDDVLAHVAGTCAILRLVAHAALRAHGYHQSKRRQWRKKPVPLPETYADTHVRASEGLDDLVTRAREDPNALKELRRVLADDPHRFVMIGFGDIAGLAKMLLIATMNKASPLRGQATAIKAELLRAELEGPTPTVVERLLVERIVLSWLTVHWIEADLALFAPRDAFPQAARLDRRLSRASARYVQALKALASVRRLDLSPMMAVVQVNVGAAPTRVVPDPPPPVETTRTEAPPCRRNHRQRPTTRSPR